MSYNIKMENKYGCKFNNNMTESNKNGTATDEDKASDDKSYEDDGMFSKDDKEEFTFRYQTAL